MSKVINMSDKTFIITMKGKSDLRHYCEKCHSNEFHTCIGTSCAHCGHDVAGHKHTIFDCSDEEKDYLLAKENYVNNNICRVGMSEYSIEGQKRVNREFDRLYKERNNLK